MAQAITIRPEDLVVGLLADVRRQAASGRFDADPVTIHTRFFEWRKKPEFAQLFGEFIFDTRDYFPYSETLDGVFDGLQLAGYLERTNPRGTWYQITSALVNLSETDIESKFDESQRKAISDLAGEFVKSIRTDHGGS